MQRTRILCLIGSLLAISQAAAAEPAVQAPAPAEVKRKLAPPPSATPPTTPAQKTAVPAAKGSEKKAADKKEKKPKVLARDLFGKMPTAAALAPRALGWYLSLIHI